MKKKLLALASMAATLMVGSTAFAQDIGANAFDANKWYALAAAIAISLAAFGGAIGQGRVAAAALEGIARNPNASGKIFVPMILGLALIESLVIYALLISFNLTGQIGG